MLLGDDHDLASQSERERIDRIRSGFKAVWLTAAKTAFCIPLSAVASLSNSSNSTLQRRIKNKTRLDPAASERMDRLAHLALLAENIFEEKNLQAFG